MLSNAYLLATFRFDTAENEPAKNLQNFEKFSIVQNKLATSAKVHRRRGVRVEAREEGRRLLRPSQVVRRPGKKRMTDILEHHTTGISC